MTKRLCTFALGLLFVTGCGGPGSAGKGVADPPLPSGPGTKRSLVLVDDDAPKAAKPAADGSVSTSTIMRKVIDGR